MNYCPVCQGQFHKEVWEKRKLNIKLAFTAPLTHFNEGAQTSHVLDKRYPALHWKTLYSSQVYITAGNTRGCTSLLKLHMKKKYRLKCCLDIILKIIMSIKSINSNSCFRHQGKNVLMVDKVMHRQKKADLLKQRAGKIRLSSSSAMIH